VLPGIRNLMKTSLYRLDTKNGFESALRRDRPTRGGSVDFFILCGLFVALWALLLLIAAACLP